MQLLEQFQSQGFVVVENFLGDEFASLQQEVERYVREEAPQASSQDAFYSDPSRPETLRQLHRMERDPYFAACRQHSRWRRLAESLLQESVEAMGVEWFNKPPGCSQATPPHQDNFYFCLRPPQVLTLWLALDDIHEANGCLRYVRGSHRHGLLEHQPTGTLGFSQGIVDYEPWQAQEQAVCVRAGDLLVHHGNTIHRADANVSESPRRSLAIVFRASNVERDVDAFAQYQAALQRQQAQQS